MPSNTSSTSAVIRGFLAGFAATLVFHQGLLELYYLAGVVSHPAWGIRLVPPFGVPQMISLAFWGGVWGVVLALLTRTLTHSAARWKS